MLREKHRNAIKPLGGALALLLLLGLSACVPGQVLLSDTEKRFSYRSEYTDPGAKALYAYSQYRLLAAENRWDEAIAALNRALAFDPESALLRMSLAKALLHKNELERATDILQTLVRKEPGHVEGHELLGDLLSYQNNYQQAIEQYRTALELTPENELLQMRLAMALGRAGQNDEAIRVLETLVASHPEIKLARLSLARFYQETGRPAMARATYRKLLKHYPDHQQGILELGKILEEQQLLNEAFDLYREGIRTNPRAAALRQRLALLYLQQNRFPEALEQLHAVRQQFPENLQISGRIALIHLELEHWTLAETELRELLRQEPEEDRHRYYLGMALIGQGENSAAIEVMAPIKESSPVFPEAVLQLAYLYKRAGQLDRAVNSLRTLISLDIQQPEIYYYLAAFLGDQEKLNEAEQVIAAGLETFPDDADLLYQLGIVYEKLNDRDRAIETMQKVLAVDAEHADALNFIAYHQAERGDQLELALTRAQKALEVKKSGYIIDTLGWIYFKMGRFEKSREQLEEASTLHPDDPVILEHLGDLYRALTLWDKAAEAYRKVLELSPQAEGVEKKLHALPKEKRE